MMRLGLAALVALVHAQAIGWGDQPHLGQSQIGDLAVDGFFVISGFLVTRSATRLPTLRRFVWHRALRILPGFWTCLVMVAFVAAPIIAWLQGLKPSAAFSGPDSALNYVLRNAGLLIRQWDIAGLAGETRIAMDGSLWTLFYEALCYAAVGLLVAAGILRRRRQGPAEPRLRSMIGRLAPTHLLPEPVRRHLIVVLAVFAWIIHFGHSTGSFALGSDYFARFLLMFLLGALGHIYAHRLRFPLVPLVAAVVVLALALVLFGDYRLLGAPAFAYLFLWAVVALPLRWEPAADLSYGLYVYHWPVELILVSAGVASAGRLAFTLTAVAVTSLLAYVSWRLVESPALRQKNAVWIDTFPSRWATRFRPQGPAPFRDVG